jgi:hypothetical protein
MKFFVSSVLISLVVAAPGFQNISGGDSIFAGPINTDRFSGSKFSDFGAFVRRGIVQGLGLLGGNGNSNEDSSVSNTVFAHGNQQLSGQNINNNPVLSTGGMDVNMSTHA